MNLFYSKNEKRYILDLRVSDDPEIKKLLDEIRDLSEELQRKIDELKYKDVGFIIDPRPKKSDDNAV